MWYNYICIGVHKIEKGEIMTKKAGYNMNLVRETKNYVGNKRKIHEPEKT